MGESPADVQLYCDLTPDPPSHTLSFPSSLPALRSLAGQLQLLKERHFYHVLILFAAAYLYKQTFAIPGSAFLVGTVY